MASLSSLIAAQDAREERNQKRINEVETWIVENLKPQYHTHKELKKILSLLKKDRRMHLNLVGASLLASKKLLYDLAHKEVSRPNATKPLSEALSAWNGEDFVFTDSPSEATDDHMSDEVESIPDNTQVSKWDELVNKYPDWLDEGGSSGSKRREPERSDVPDPPAADSNGSASGPEEAIAEVSVWTSTKSKVSSTGRTKPVRNWTDHSRTGGKALSFDSDSDKETDMPVAQCMSATEAEPKKQKIRENVFGTCSLFGSASSTPACASQSEKVLCGKPKPTRQLPAWACSGQQSTPAASGGSSSKSKKVKADATPLERLDSMGVDLLWSLRISFGLQSALKTKASLIAQLQSYLEDVHSTRGFGIHELTGPIRSAGHLPQLTLIKYVMLWNGETFDPLPPPVVEMQEPVMTLQALDKQPAVKQELVSKPKSCITCTPMTAQTPAQRAKLNSNAKFNSVINAAPVTPAPVTPDSNNGIAAGGTATLQSQEDTLCADPAHNAESDLELSADEWDGKPGAMPTFFYWSPEEQQEHREGKIQRARDRRNAKYDTDFANQCRY